MFADFQKQIAFLLSVFILEVAIDEFIHSTVQSIAVLLKWIPIYSCYADKRKIIWDSNLYQGNRFHG